MSYFSNFGSAWYTFKDGSTNLVNDITKFATFRDVYKNDPRTQLVYTIKDGDLPHMISNKLYGTVDYWWTVLLVNNIYDFEEQWPRSQEALMDYIENKYPFRPLNDVHHWVAANGTITDLTATRIQLGVGTDEAAIAKGQLSPVTIIDYEMAMNELKRNIVLVDPDYITTVAAEFVSLMNG